MTGVGDVVAHVGLWWPAADEDGLRAAAGAWERAAGTLEQAVEAGRSGVAQASPAWSGAAADRFEQAWGRHEQTLRDDGAACRALADGLTRYADGVADAKRRVEELAVTAGATVVAGAALGVLTVGVSAAVAGEVTSALVAAAAAVGVELSATVAAISAGALTGAVFGAGEAAVVDMAVTQPLRVLGFHDGGFSLPEVAGSVSGFALGGGAIGGALGAGAVRPMARIAEGDLSGVRAHGGTIRAALDPTNWGPQGSAFRVGVVKPVGVKFKPHELSIAQLLADRGDSVHLRPNLLIDKVKNPDALVRSHPSDPGTYMEFKEVRGTGPRSVIRHLQEGQEQLEQWGGGEVVIDGRRAGLTERTAREGLDSATRIARSGGDPVPERARIMLGDNRMIRWAGGEVLRVD